MHFLFVWKEKHCIFCSSIRYYAEKGFFSYPVWVKEQKGVLWPLPFEANIRCWPGAGTAARQKVQYSLFYCANYA